MPEPDKMPLLRSWLVVDMDGTITPQPSKAGGQYEPLTQSPCFSGLSRWIRAGGSVCVLSTAGARMWKQIWEPLRSIVVDVNCQPGDAPELILGAFNGAALYRFSADKADLIEISSYRTRYNTTLDLDVCDKVQTILRRILCRFFALAQNDDTFVTALSKKYQEPFRYLLAQRESLGIDRFEDDCLNLKAILTYGLYLKETNDALLDIQYVDTGDGKVPALMTLLGIPMARFDVCFTKDDLEQLSALNCYVKSQPNSVCVGRKHIDKSTAIRYLIEAGANNDLSERKMHFRLANSIAAGDNPASVDRPMTLFLPEMPFISLSKLPDSDPPGVIHVGDEEEGFARFLDSLMEYVDSRNIEPEQHWITETVLRTIAMNQLAARK